MKNTVSYLRGNYSITPGYYIGVEWTTKNVTGYFVNRNSDRTRYYFSFLPAVVGQQALVTNQSDGFGDFIEYVTVAAVDTYGNPSAYSDGVSVSFDRQTPMSSAKFYQFKDTVTNNFAWFAVFQSGNYYNNYACAIIDNGIIYPMGRCNETITVAQNDITETTILTARVDAQPEQLSVNSNQVKYTLSDGVTKINMVSDDTISGTPVNFTSAAVSGNIASGETLGVMMKKLNQALNRQYINSSYWTVNDNYVTSYNLYGHFIGAFNLLIIEGWFQLQNGDIPYNAQIFKFNGYFPITQFNSFFAEAIGNNQRNSVQLIGSNNSNGYFLFNNREFTSNDIFYGCPTMCIMSAL